MRCLALVVLFAACASAASLTAKDIVSAKKDTPHAVGDSVLAGTYSGSSDGMWYSSVTIENSKNFTITVTGPHSGNVPHSTCHNVAYTLKSDGSFEIPDSFGVKNSCYWYLRTGNNGVLTLTWNSAANTIKLGVRVPSTDITMHHHKNKEVAATSSNATLAGRYSGNYGPWYSSVTIENSQNFTITVTGPHSGYVPHSTCRNVGYSLKPDGSLHIPDSYGVKKSCYWYLRTGNNGVLSLTWNSQKNTILLGVQDPSTDITMVHHKH